MPNKWEIWLAYFKFEETNDYKERPVLILENKYAYPILVAKITTHKPRKEFEREYEIVDWKKAGLNEKSTIRLSKVLLLQNNDFIMKLGKLQATDIYNIIQLLQEIL